MARFGAGEGGSADIAAIRALRADPPGKATAGDRRKTFGAGLEQFEQLHSVARDAGAASAPILLFYALAQAGKAILAAHAGEDWQASGHGLSIRIESDEIAKTVVKPNGDGLFQAVSRATASAVLSAPLTLGEVRARVPRLPRSQGLEPEGVRLLTVSSEPVDQRVIRDERGSLLPAGEDGRALKDLCPALANAEINTREQGSYAVINLDFASDGEAAAFDAFLWPYLGQRFLPTADKTPSGLMLWWMILLGLSSFARYEPARWTAAINPDESTVAVPLEQTLEIAAVHLPALVLEGLTRAAPES
jgi:hypothetical protein